MKGPVNPSGMVPAVLMAASTTAIDVFRTAIGLEPVLVNSRVDLNPMKLNYSLQKIKARDHCIYCKEIS